MFLLTRFAMLIFASLEILSCTKNQTKKGFSRRPRVVSFQEFSLLFKTFQDFLILFKTIRNA